MTITLPDAGVTAAILAIGSAIVWAIRTITNKHVAVLDEMGQTAKAIKPLVEDISETVTQMKDYIETRDDSIHLQLVHLRKAVKKLNPSAFVCDDCIGWYGEPSECPEGLHMCRCSDPNAVPPAASRPERISSLPHTPPGGIAAVAKRHPAPSRPDSGERRPRRRAGSQADPVEAAAGKR